MFSTQNSKPTAKTFILSILLILNFSLFGQEVKSNVSPYALHIIQNLASDAFLGRGYVDEGMNRTADFIADEFEKFGLEKVNGSYFQEFEMPINILENARLILNGKELKYGIDFIVKPSSYSQSFYKKDTYTFPAYDFENSITSETRFIDFIQRDMIQQKGKHVVFPPHTFQVDSLNNYYKNWSSFYRPEENQNRALLFFTKDKLTSSLSTHQDSLALFYVSEDFYSKNLRIDDYKIESNFQSTYKTKNVIGKIKGKSDSLIVLTAHFDHLGKVGETIFHGASDNASGTAFLLELAKYFSKNPPEYTLVFIAFAAEEAGMVGSNYFVENPEIDLAKIKFLLNFDIMGAGNEGIQIVNSTIFTNEYDLLNQINFQKKYTSQIRKRGEACNSDHCPFYQKGVPSFFIYTLGGPGHYHDPLDIAESLNLAGFEGLKRLFIEFIQKL